MTYNLLAEPWIPVRREDGSLDRVAAQQIGDKDVVSVAVPRPDFDAAVTQWLVGLVQTCMTPRNLDEWCRLSETPPSREVLGSRMKPMEAAFDLCDDVKPFMQDPTSQEGTLFPVTDLLIESPTGQMVRRNADLFVKRRSQGQLCLPCAAMAVFTLQSNAPEGGRGHNTSVRGGGPITTLVEGQTLWDTVWNNVLIENDLHRLEGDCRLVAQEHTFPWMGELRPGGKTGTPTTPDHGHPLMVYWATPRRLLLDPADQEGPCFVCAEPEEGRISGFRSKPNGFQYKEWVHPLTPHRQGSEGLISLKGGKGAMTARDWMGWVQDDPEGKRTPAMAVRSYVEGKMDRVDAPVRMWCSGYWTDQSTVVHWQETRFPLHLTARDHRDWYQKQCNHMVAGAMAVQQTVETFLRKWLFHPRLAIKGDIGCLSDDFWSRIGDVFFLQQPRLLRRPSDATQGKAVLSQWYDLCCKEGRHLYQIYAHAATSRPPDDPVVSVDTTRLDERLRSDKVLAAFGLKPPAEKKKQRNQNPRRTWTHHAKNP